MVFIHQRSYVIGANAVAKIAQAVGIRLLLLNHSLTNMINPDAFGMLSAGHISRSWNTRLVKRGITCNKLVMDPNAAAKEPAVRGGVD